MTSNDDIHDPSSKRASPVVAAPDAVAIPEKASPLILEQIPNHAPDHKLAPVSAVPNGRPGPFEVRGGVDDDDDLCNETALQPPTPKAPPRRPPRSAAPLYVRKNAAAASGFSSSVSGNTVAEPRAISAPPTVRASALSRARSSNQDQPAEETGYELADDGLEPPVRRYDCVNYETCLDLAASLNWESFSCGGCNGEVNQALYWRAHQSQRKDSVARALCELKPISSVSHQPVTQTRSEDEGSK